MDFVIPLHAIGPFELLGLWEGIVHQHSCVPISWHALFFPVKRSGTCGTGCWSTVAEQMESIVNRINNSLAFCLGLFVMPGYQCFLTFVLNLVLCLFMQCFKLNKPSYHSHYCPSPFIWSYFICWFNFNNFFLWCHIFSLSVAFYIAPSPPPPGLCGCCFFQNESVTIFPHPLCTQLQFAYTGPQETVKPSTCEYLTNKQIARWQGEMQGQKNKNTHTLQFSGGSYFAPRLQFHSQLLNFNVIYAPPSFDQVFILSPVHTHVNMRSRPNINKFTGRYEKYACVASSITQTSGENI